MSFEVLRPYALLIIPASILFVLLTSTLMVRMVIKKKLGILFTRCVVYILVALSLAGISVKWKIDKTTTMFVMDASDSTTSSREELEKFVRDSLAVKPKKDRSGIVAFGGNSLIEQFISKDNTFGKIETKPIGTYTNIENALTSALSLIPQNNKKRIVLLTDGEENDGSMAKAIPSLQEQNVDFKVFKLERKIEDEVAIDNISIPEKINLGDDFTVVANITSNISTSAKVTLYSGREKRSEMQVELQKGKNRFVFKDNAEKGGFNTYKVVVEPDKDTELRNNEYSSFTNVQAKPKILLIEDKDGEASEMEKILQASKMDYRKINVAAAPRSIEELNAYKTIISCNVHAENYNSGFMNSIESYVKDFAGGFIATGGDDSFILGGYLDTPLEKILPVYMDMRGKKEIPEISLGLVIDRSGSMTGGNGTIKKIDLAKDAAIKAADTLRDKDEIGVIAFDDKVEWAVERQKAQNRNEIKNKISGIAAGGGTLILPALQEAYSSLKKSSTKIKHIILLTDGQGEQADYNSILEKLKQEKITVSTVAVGQDADKKLMEDIAKKCGGRYYYTDENTNLPRIFAKEIFLASAVYLQNREFTPVISSSHQVLYGVAVDNKLPNLFGYVASSQKETAKVILKSDEDDPILSTWQYGLGKTIAWNSDISGKWSKNYVNWDKNLKLWQNIINWTIENYGDENGYVETSTEGNKATITLNTKNAGEELTVDAKILSPSMESSEIKLNAAAPGKYSAVLDMKETGVYMVSVRQKKGGEVLAAINAGIALQYSPEYRVTAQNNVLDKLVAESGAQYIKTPQEVFSGELADITGKTLMTPYFLVAAIFIFMLDIAARKLNINLKRKKKKEAEVIASLGKDKIRNTENLYGSGTENVREMENGKILKDDEVKKDEKEILDTGALLNKRKNRYQ